MPIPAVLSAMGSAVRKLPRRRLAAITAGSAGAAALLLGVLVRLEVVQDEVDAEWMAEILEARGPVPDAIALLFDFIGGGWFAIALVPLVVAGLFLLVQVLLGAYALHLDHEPLRAVWALPLQQFVYRQLMYLVVIQSVVTALAGARLDWQPLQRRGSARVLTDP